MSDPRVVLRDIQERADKATPGPWEPFITDHGHSRTGEECSVITQDVGDTVCDMRSIDRLDLNERYRDEGIRDTFFIAAARADVPKLVAALRAVLDLHRRVDAQKPWCVHCGKASASFVDYPCDTVRAITDTLGDA